MKTATVLASSWNPPTTAHIKLIGINSPDIKIAVLSLKNADKGLISRTDDVHRQVMISLAIPEAERYSTTSSLFVDMARELRYHYPGVELNFTMGEDTVTRFLDPKYIGEEHDKRLEEFFRYHKIYCVERYGYGSLPVEKLHERIIMFEDPFRADHSSTRARKELKENKYSTIVPKDVIDYAIHEGLYE